MEAKTYLKVSAVNLIFLAAGMLVSPIIVKSIDSLLVVHAQDDKAAKVPAKIDAARTAPSCDESRYECVSPGITTGTAAFGIVLANRIGADQLMVNGYEPLKLHDNTLKLLIKKGLISEAEVQQVVNASKADKPLRLKTAPSELR